MATPREHPSKAGAAASQATSRLRGGPNGLDPRQLSDTDLFRELASLHRTRLDTLRHGSDDALARHDRRVAELEQEYRRRYPEREISPDRLREGARQRR